MNFLPSGIIGPLQPRSSSITTVYLIITAAVFAATSGYDSGLVSGINIMPAYTDFLHLTTATKALNTAANFIGWGIASLTMGPVVNRLGRKNSILFSLLVKAFSIGLIAGARNMPMFLCGRIILGVAKGTAGIAGATWLAECLPAKIRGLGLSITFSVYYVGALMASGITYRTAAIDGNWCWRLPCLLQIIPSISSGICLFCTPESPRWLAYQDRNDDALRVIASLQSNGDQTAPIVATTSQEIIAARDWERLEGRKVGFMELFKTRAARKRVMLAASVGVLAMGSGNNIASYFIGDMLDNAGITGQNTQLQINVVLNSWCLVCSGIGTVLMDRVGRKTLALFSCVGMTISMFLLGGLTKAYGTSQHSAGIYGAVASIFLFMGAYGVGITPLTQLYPAEVLSYPIRANGMAIWSGTVAVFAILTSLCLPIGLGKIGWKIYMIVAAWDFLELVFVKFFWIETKNLTLEEIDRVFEGSVVYDGESLDGSGRSGKDGQKITVTTVSSALQYAAHKIEDIKPRLHIITGAHHAPELPQLWNQHPEQRSRLRRFVIADQCSVLAQDPTWTQAQLDTWSCALFKPSQVYTFSANMSNELVPLLTTMFTKDFSRAEFDWMVAQNLKMSDHNAATLLINHAFADWRDVLPSINVPTKVLSGAISLNNATGINWAATQIPGATAYTFAAEEKGSHFVFWENPDRFNQVVEEFLSP